MQEIVTIDTALGAEAVGLLELAEMGQICQAKLMHTDQLIRVHQPQAI